MRSTRLCAEIRRFDAVAVDAAVVLLHGAPQPAEPVRELGVGLPVERRAHLPMQHRAEHGDRTEQHDRVPEQQGDADRSEHHGTM
jgi:hypothetical protein